MDGRDWQATVHGVARVGHESATKPPQPWLRDHREGPRLSGPTCSEREKLRTEVILQLPPLRGQFGDAAGPSGDQVHQYLLRRGARMGQRPGTHGCTCKDLRWPWGGPCRRGVCSGHSAGPPCCAGSHHTRPHCGPHSPGMQSRRSDSGQSGRYSGKQKTQQSYERSPGSPRWASQGWWLPAPSPIFPSSTFFRLLTPSI